MAKVFKGRPILPGDFSGEALVSRGGFNTLASFQKSVILRQKQAVCSDQNNPDLYEKVMSGKVLCLPQTIGSTTGGLVIQTVAQRGIAPAAMLFSEHIDSLAAAGVILTDIWEGVRIIVIDQLGPEFLQTVKTGHTVQIFSDGMVEVQV
jgi:predicted aconitase with swiveling domain